MNQASPRDLKVKEPPRAKGYSLKVIGIGFVFEKKIQASGLELFWFGKIRREARGILELPLMADWLLGANNGYSVDILYNILCSFTKK